MTRQYRIPVLEEFGFQQAVKSVLSSPPIAPSKGDRYIVGSSAVGLWTGQENKIAYCSSAFGPEWSFDMPDEGWLAWVEDVDNYYSFNGTTWAALAVSSGAVGTKTVDESNIADNRILVYDLGSDTLVYEDQTGGTGTGNSYFPAGW